MSPQKSKTKTVPLKQAGRKNTEKAAASLLPNPITSKREARKMIRKVAPWLIVPEEIRKEVFALVRKGHSFAFAKQLTLVLRLSYEAADLYEQQTAMNPGLVEAQETGTIKQKIWKTLDELGEAWKVLIKIP